MTFKSAIGFTVAWLIIITATRAQSVHISGDGLLYDSLQPVTKGKQITILTAGGFVHIQQKNKPGVYHYRAYYPGNQGEVKWELPTELYLKVGGEYKMEVISGRADSIIYSYAIRRVKAVPTLNLVAQSTGLNRLLSASGTITLPPNEAFTVQTAGNAGFENQAIDVTLINLKNGKIAQRLRGSETMIFKLDPGSEYELRFNYVIQPESAGSCYIKSEPYWYRSTPTYVTLAVLVSGVCIWIVIIIQKRRIKLIKNRQEELEQAALKLQSQFNPHFMFNALSTIQGLMNTGRIDEANDYLQDFSSLLRNTLNKSRQIFHGLDHELQMMRIYIRLEALRFNFSWEIYVSEAIELSAIEIPTLLLQPVIENAIRHGLSSLGDKGRLEVLCEEKNNDLLITVKDNGKWTDQTGKSGFGLSLTEERMKTINRLKHEKAITLTFVKNNGTNAIFTFHHWINI